MRSPIVARKTDVNIFIMMRYFVVCQRLPQLTKYAIVAWYVW
jgi:hypothetical protein